MTYNQAQPLQINFTRTSTDFAGPMYLRDTLAQYASTSKAYEYICLFTCCSTQAIHLEMIID